MKLIIASDIHGSAYWCGKLMELIEAEQPDRIILLGDLLYHGPRNDLPRDYAPKKVIPMLSQYADRILAVRGNCDAEVDQMVLPFHILSEAMGATFDGVPMHLTHGHHENPQNLPSLAENCVLLFGHTHVKLDETVDGVRCLNPGSVSIPKDGSHSCIVFDRGAFRFHIWED